MYTIYVVRIRKNAHTILFYFSIHTIQMTNLDETDTCGSKFFRDFERFLQSIYSKFYNTNESENESENENENESEIIYDDVDISLNDDIYSVRMDLSKTLLNIKPFSNSIQ